MLHHPNYEGLRALRLDGMAEVFAKLEAGSSGDGLFPAEWLSLLVDRERSLREMKRCGRRLRKARLRHAGARPESVDYRTRRGLDRGLFERLCGGRWITEGRNLILTGPCGVGNTWLCCALAQVSCRRGERALYRRTARLLWNLEAACGDGSYPRLFRGLSEAHLLALDDFGPDWLAYTPFDFLVLPRIMYSALMRRPRCGVEGVHGWTNALERVVECTGTSRRGGRVLGDSSCKCLIGKGLTGVRVFSRLVVVVHYRLAALGKTGRLGHDGRDSG